MVKEKLSPRISDQASLEKDKELIVHNDDINTFEYVIKTLIEVCNHEPQQAEQCTLIIHYKGKCTVKSGDLGLLKPMRDEILQRGINATIN